MAPAADMFEMGVQVQVLKRGTMFPMRAARLYRLYRDNESIGDLQETDVAWLERDVFRQSLQAAWDATETYLRSRSPQLLEEANASPKRKLALLFRSYLGQSSNWAQQGDVSRALDYQIWAGPAIGAFNAWTKGSILADVANRHVVPVARTLMYAGAHHLRLQLLSWQGIRLPTAWTQLSADWISEFCRSSSKVDTATHAVSDHVVGSGNCTVVTSAISSQSNTPIDVGDKSLMASQSKNARIKTSTRATAPGVEEIEEWILEQLAGQIGVHASQIDRFEPFAEFGMESIHAMVVVGRLEKWLNLELSPTMIWNYPTIKTLAQRLAQLAAAQ
jgi:acyl carrier protein